MRVQTRQPTKIPSQLHPIAEVLARRDFRRNGETAYGVIDEIALAGNCAIEFDVCSSLATPFYVFGYAGGYTSRFSIGTNGSFNIRTTTNNNAFNAPSGTIKPNKISNVRIELDGFNLEVFVNKISIGSASTGGGFRINQLFRNSDVVRGGGIVANLKFYDDSNGSELVVDMPLTKYLPNPNIIPNLAKPLGANQYSFSNVGTVEGVNIVETHSGFTSTSAAPNLDRTYVNLTTEIGKQYRLISNRVALSGAASLTLFVREDAGGAGTVIASTGDVDVDLLFTATTTTTSILYDAPNTSDVVSYEVANISIRKAEGWGQYINPLDEDWGNGPFELQWNGDWLGWELLVNHNFSQGAIGWAGTGSASIIFANNQLVYDGDTNQVISQQVANIGIFRISADIASLTRNAMVPRPQFQVTGNSGYQPITDGTLGQHSIDYVVNNAGNTNAYFELGQFGTGAEYKVNSFSVKEVLKSA